MALELELVRLVFSELALAKDWVNGAYLDKQTGCASKEVQSSIAALFKGAYIVREQRGKEWFYRMNPVMTLKQIESLADVALTTEDFLAISPIPLEDRQIFKYQKRAEVVSLKESVDAAKQKGDIQLENLESLAIASSEALEKYIESLTKKDKKLMALRQMSKGCEAAFWEYAKALPRN